MTYRLVDRAIYREVHGALVPLLSPCCGAQIAEPVLVTAVCLGCGHIVYVDAESVDGYEAGPPRVAVGETFTPALLGVADPTHGPHGTSNRILSAAGPDESPLNGVDPGYGPNGELFYGGHGDYVDLTLRVWKPPWHRSSRRLSRRLYEWWYRPTYQWTCRREGEAETAPVEGAVGPILDMTSEMVGCLISCTLTTRPRFGWRLPILRYIEIEIEIR